VVRRGGLGDGSVDVTIDLPRDDQHLTGSAAGVGVLCGPFELLRPVSDEMAMRGHPYLAGPAAAAQPTGADGAAAGEIRLVLNE
jgi:hypothetical protein